MGRVSREWADATLIPIPKKGNLSLCDNWRGIALFGKVVARIILARLQRLAEEVLYLSSSVDSGRTMDALICMVFTVRQLVEKAIEHHTPQFFLFIDLRKAYDSVPRTLQKVICNFDIRFVISDASHQQKTLLFSYT